MFIYGISDIVGLVVLAILLLVWLVLWAMQAYSQWVCPHDNGVGETQACHAICRSCGKNLGSIGTYRERQSKKEEPQTRT